MENWFCLKTEMELTGLQTIPETDLVLSFWLLHMFTERWNYGCSFISRFGMDYLSESNNSIYSFISAIVQKTKEKAYYYRKEK